MFIPETMRLGPTCSDPSTPHGQLDTTHAADIIATSKAHTRETSSASVQVGNPVYVPAAIARACARLYVGIMRSGPCCCVSRWTQLTSSLHGDLQKRKVQVSHYMHGAVRRSGMRR